MQTGNTSALITLQSGSTDEMMLPGNLREIVIDDSIINSFLLTSKTKCIPGVADESCLLINIKRNPSWPGINAIHGSENSWRFCYRSCKCSIWSRCNVSFHLHTFRVRCYTRNCRTRNCLGLYIQCRQDLSGSI